MPYTFWHGGILIGDADLEERPDYPRQRGGIFHPTAYGLDIFPRLTGMLSAAHALKSHLEANGLSPDEMQKSQIEEVLDTTAAGQKIIDIGRALSEVEMRAPDGRRLAFASIAFSDLLELQRLARELDVESADSLTDLPADAPRYIVSATLAEETADSTTSWDDEGGRIARRPWPNDN